MVRLMRSSFGGVVELVMEEAEVVEGGGVGGIFGEDLVVESFSRGEAIGLVVVEGELEFFVYWWHGRSGVVAGGNFVAWGVVRTKLVRRVSSARLELVGHGYGKQKWDCEFGKPAFCG